PRRDAHAAARHLQLHAGAGRRCAGLAADARRHRALDGGAHRLGAAGAPRQPSAPLGMTLEVEVRARLGSFELSAAFAAGPGITTLFGRSGAGKTSIVNMVAGLLRPAAGRIVVEGETLFDAARGIDVRPWRRR